MDKNYISYEERNDEIIEGGTIRPPAGTSDAVKAWKCRRSAFHNFNVHGGKEDVLDVGQDTHHCTFHRWRAHSKGQYVVTDKGGNFGNLYFDWVIERPGSEVDFEFNNWHSYNLLPSRSEVIDGAVRLDGKPVTFAYRLFAGKNTRPTFVNTRVKHLWWRSIGLTLYWWYKYTAHILLRIPDPGRSDKSVPIVR
jgi:hypothetical protein